MPTRAMLPGSLIANVYFLELEAITSEQKQRLIAHLAKRFKLPVEEVASDIDAAGVPLLDQDITVAFDIRMVL